MTSMDATRGSAVSEARRVRSEFQVNPELALPQRLSSAPGLHWTSDWDIIHLQIQEPTPMSNTPNPGKRGRFSAPRKAATALRLLRGESLELLARELGATAATLAGWRDDFLADGQAALKSRPADDRDEEIARLRA
jgi:hypothetical protein